MSVTYEVSRSPRFIGTVQLASLVEIRRWRRAALSLQRCDGQAHTSEHASSPVDHESRGNSLIFTLMCVLGPTTPTGT